MRTSLLLTTALLCLLLPTAAATGNDERAVVPEIDIPYERFVLDNGLTLIVHEDHKAPIVAVNVWYHVGSKNEKVGKTGFAHLFEHLMFNGSENSTDDYFQALERAGATDLNGTTNKDRTNYFQNVPTPALDMVLWLESDRMGHLLGAIDQDKLDEQRGVVQNEKRQSENQPYAVSRELIEKAVYPAAHPYSHTVIGLMEDLAAASLEDVQEWFKTYYGAANAVVVLAGDIDTETAKRKVEKYFGDIPAGPPVTHAKSWIAQRTGSQREVALDRVATGRRCVRPTEIGIESCGVQENSILLDQVIDHIGLVTIQPTGRRHTDHLQRRKGSIHVGDPAREPDPGGCGDRGSRRESPSRLRELARNRYRASSLPPDPGAESPRHRGPDP